MDTDRRAAAIRFKVSLAVQGRVPATPIMAKLANVSLTGCMLETAECELIAPGATILLTISNIITLAGQVVWRVGSRVGIKFQSRASEDTLVRIRRASSHLNVDTMAISDSFGRDLPDLASIRPLRAGRP